ncbi:MAG: glycine C-acetyltransferase [Gammaproteobacteria bacterium]|nr:glycine C-acetyltransferase [Gammaproteobacteria bacterium]
MNKPHSLHEELQDNLNAIREQGLFKSEKAISSPQSAQINIREHEQAQRYLNLCANNYLGLADDQRLIDAAKLALDEHGFGMASVRFICGTSTLHQQLEEKMASFLGQDDCILYSSCFDANTGLFETILTADDAIVSDSLNHASIIDGVRLCKAKRYRYANNDMVDLEENLKRAVADGAKSILIATDGVFSMDGIIADLSSVCDLADKYGALVMVDDSHAVGVIGDNGRGAIEYCGVMDRVDIVTGTLGKALGGASGGYTAGKASIIETLRQKSRPYLFSNALAPMITAASIKALEIVSTEPTRLQKLHGHAQKFRAAMQSAGFELAGAGHPIIPVMVGDAVKAKEFSDALSKRGVMAVNFSFPVVPKGQARIRTQMSAALSDDDLQAAIDAFMAAGKEVGLIS